MHTNLIPQFCKVPFRAFRLQDPSVIYADKSFLGMSHTELCNKYAWIVPGESDKTACDDISKELLAERYGGLGLGTNGGGVRCGLSDDHQIKGVGCNQLLGEQSPLDYSHGGMSLFECIQELVWSEVLHYALPFGAARMLAVIATGTQCWWVFDRWGELALQERYGAPPRLPRGLLVRDAILRPAHFERAVLFAPREEIKASLIPDSERVRLAIKELPFLLPVNAFADAEKLAKLPDVQRLTLGLQEMAGRFAIQSVAAKCKRIIHGNISSSNISLDGRWIDFGSTTAVPGWGAVRDYGPFWDDEDLYFHIFSNLIYFIEKYSSISRESLNGLIELMFNEYKNIHACEIKRRFISMSGLPFILIDFLGDTIVTNNFSDLMSSRVKLGYCYPQCAHSNDHARFGGWDPLESTCRHASLSIL